MNAVVIGAAKPGYAEAITRKLIKNGFKVIVYLQLHSKMPIILFGDL